MGNMCESPEDALAIEPPTFPPPPLYPWKGYLIDNSGTKKDLKYTKQEFHIEKDQG